MSHWAKCFLCKGKGSSHRKSWAWLHAHVVLGLGVGGVEQWILLGQQRCSPSGWVTDTAIAQQGRKQLREKNPMSCTGLHMQVFIIHIHTHNIYIHTYSITDLASKCKYVSHLYSQYTRTHCITHIHKNKYTFIKIGIMPVYVYVCFMCLFIFVLCLCIYIYICICVCALCVCLHMCKSLSIKDFTFLTRHIPFQEKKIYLWIFYNE